MGEEQSQQHLAGVVQHQDALGSYVAIAGILRWDRRTGAAGDADDPLRVVRRRQGLGWRQHQSDGLDLGQQVVARVIFVEGRVEFGEQFVRQSRAGRS